MQSFGAPRHAMSAEPLSRWTEGLEVQAEQLGEEPTGEPPATPLRRLAYSFRHVGLYFKSKVDQLLTTEKGPACCTLLQDSG